MSDEKHSDKFPIKNIAIINYASSKIGGSNFGALFAGRKQPARGALGPPPPPPHPSDRETWAHSLAPFSRLTPSNPVAPPPCFPCGGAEMVRPRSTTKQSALNKKLFGDHWTGVFAEHGVFVWIWRFIKRTSLSNDHCSDWCWQPQRVPKTS